MNVTKLPSATSKQSTTPQSSPSQAATPTHDQIAVRAYEIYIAKGSRGGECQQNWREAEHELINEFKSEAPQSQGFETDFENEAESSFSTRNQRQRGAFAEADRPAAQTNY